MRPELLLSLFILFCASAAPAGADHRAPGDSIFYIDGNGGLPQNSVRTVLVDHENYIWVGTERGLARFDGHRFIDFSQASPDVPVDVLVSLFEDSYGRIWTNWFKSNPRVLMPDRGEVIELRGTGADDRLVEMLHRIYEDPGGRVWFAGAASLNWMEPDGRLGSVEVSMEHSGKPLGRGHDVYVGTRGGLLHLRSDAPGSGVDFLPLAPPGQPDAAVRDMMVRHLEPWRDRVIACAPRGLHSVGGGAEDVALLAAMASETIAGCRVLGDRLFVNHAPPGSFEFRLDVFDLERQVFLEPPPGLRDTGLLNDVFGDSMGGEWVAVGGEPFYRAPGTDRFEPIELLAPIFGMSDTIAECHRGEIWIATDGAGLALSAPNRERFVTVVPPNPSNEVRSRQVRSIGVSPRDGAVWMATDERGINRWNRSTGAWRQYRTDSTMPLKELVVLPDGSIWSFDPPSRSVLRYDPTADRFVAVFGVGSNHARLAADRDGRLLVASTPGLRRYDPRNGTLERLNREDLSAPVRAMTVDSAGRIWLAIHQWGLLRLEADGGLERWTRADSGLTSDQIFALHFDERGDLWIGTWHGGLLRFDPQAETFQHFGPDNGLPDDTVFGILEGDRGELWLSTYRGLIQFAPCRPVGCEPAVRLFNQHDGLQGSEFDAEAFYRAPDGELFFGGVGGLNAFYPEDIHLNDLEPELKITRASLDGAPLPGAVSVFMPPLSVGLPARFGELRLELSAMDYNAPGKNRYQYRNSAAGPDWNDLDGPEIVLRGLPEGEQALEFRGSNNDGLWSTNPVRLEIDVLPPWYRSTAMLLVYGFLLFVTPLLYYRHRQAWLVATRTQLERQVAERTRELEWASSARERFFANISHEIAAPLHMILLMLEQHQDEDPRGRRLYRSATGYAAQLLAYLKQLVEGARSLEGDSRIYRIDAASAVRALVEVNRPLAEARRITLRTGDLPTGWVRSYRHSLSIILSNLLGNALTYAPENSEISIDGALAGDRYRLTFRNALDTRASLDLERAMQRGQRGTFDATSYGGHGLGLSIVSEAVESLGGCIRHRLDDQDCVVFEVDLVMADPALPDLPEPLAVELSREQRLAIGLIEEAPGTEPAPATGAPRLAIIEDDRNVAALMVAGLGGEFQVRTAANCRDGIELVRDWLPDIVLCDLFLPDAPGFDLVRSVRDHRMTRDALVIMLTASISGDDRKTGVELGVDHFIRKPVSSETMRLLIRNHFELARQRGERERENALRLRARQDLREAKESGFPERFETALEELYPDPVTTVEDLQHRLALSYPALVRRCRDHFGRTPKRLLVEKRVARARELLERSDHKVGVIAELTGFTSHAQFATTFRKETGLSPAQYRRSARST